jgi:hypothetical protein
MKTLLVAALAALSLGAAGQSLAAQNSDDAGFYLGIVLSRVNYKESGLSSVYPTALAVQGGWRFNPYFAVEGRAGGGVASDSLTVNGITADLKVKSYYSLLVRGNLPLADQFNLYAIAGETHGELQATSNGVSVTNSDSKASYGVGAEYVMGPEHSAVGVEYGRLFSGSGYDVDALSLTYRYNF